MIEFRNVTVKYGSNNIIFDTINLEVREGITKIIGKNGSGKSTILNTLSGIVPYSGSISGFEKVSVVSDQIKIPDDIILSHLLKKNVLDYINNQFPEYLSFVEKYKNKKVNELSTGQKRMFEIFFALSCPSDVLILDEVTNGLDYENTENVIGLINNISETKFIFFVSHDLSDYIKLDGDSYLIIKDRDIHPKMNLNKIDLVDFFVG